MERSAFQASSPGFTSLPRAEGPWLDELLAHLGRKKPLTLHPVKQGKSG